MAENPITSIFDDGKREIFIITTSDAGRLSGMTITWVTSASLIPEAKRIVLVLSPHNYTTHMLLRRRQFILHLLAQDQASLVPTFGLYSSQDVDKFVSVPFILDEESGIPIVEGVCGWAKGHIVSHTDTGEHFIILAQIETETAQPAKQSLLLRDLPQHLPADVLQLLREKYLRNVERDRRIRAQMSSQHHISG